VTAGETAVILGASSAIGRAVARALAAEGYGLILAGRNAEDLARTVADLGVRYGGRYESTIFDALDPSGCGAFVERCTTLSDGEPGAVVLCYGTTTEEERALSDPDAARRMIEVNFTSVVHIVNRFASSLEKRGGGTIAVVSSIAGDRGRQGQVIYGSAKAGVSAYCAGLRSRLARRGVHVLTVKPGFVDAAMPQGRVDPESPLLASPERVARDIVRAMRKKKNVVYTPWFWRYVMLGVRVIPETLFKRLAL
jgi:decaprenylphospho-beta-D-erythro-pentofuranosid-2-ulose 2-reductase